MSGPGTAEILRTSLAYQDQLGWELLLGGLKSVDREEQSRAYAALCKHVLDNSGIGRTVEVAFPQLAGDQAVADLRLLLAWSESFERSLSDASLEGTARRIAGQIANRELRAAVMATHDAIGRLEFVVPGLAIVPRAANRSLVRHALATLRVGDSTFEWSTMRDFLERELRELKQAPGGRYPDSMRAQRIGAVQGMLGERLAQDHPQWRETVRRAEQLGRDLAGNQTNPLNWTVQVVYEDVWMSVNKGDAVDALGHDGVVLLVQKAPDPNRPPKAVLLATMQSKGGRRASGAGPRQNLVKDAAREALGAIAVGPDAKVYSLIGMGQRSPMRFLAASDPTTAKLYADLGMREANVGWLQYGGADLRSLATDIVDALERAAQAK